MIPHERSLVDEMKDKPFALIGVNSDDTLEELKAVQKKEGITWRSFFDGPSGAIAQQFNIQGWPTVFLLDKEMKIRWKGYRSPDAKLLNELIADAEGKSAPAGEGKGEKAKSKSGD